MRRVLFAATASLFAASGCQHIAPEPLDLTATAVALRERPLDIAPIRDFAAALSALTGDESAVFDASDGLTLREAQAVALWYNLDLRIARLEAERAGAAADTAGRWADPELGLEGGEKEVDGTELVSVEQGGAMAPIVRERPTVERSWISAGSLSITVPLSGRLRAEKRLYASEHDAALLRAAEAEHLLLAEVREAWAVWSASAARIDSLNEHLALLAPFAETADSLAQAGELIPSSARVFSIERMRQEAEAERERHAGAEARAALLHLLGLLPDAPVELIPELNAPAPPPAALEAHPRIARLRAEYQTAEDRLRVELRKQYPDIVLSPAFSNEDDESSITLGMGFPLPVWNANRPGIAEAAAERDIARARTEAEMQRLLAEGAQAAAALEGSRAQRQRLLDHVVPAVDAQVAEVQALLAAGEIDFVLVYDALLQTQQTRQDLLNAALSEALAAARLSAAAVVTPAEIAP
jgi:outer membrane protein TolC